MRPELKFTRQERNQRERRARRQQDHQLTATIAALGAGETEDWPQDTTEHHKPARRAKGRTEAMPVLSAKFMSARDVTDQDLRGFNMGDEQQ